MYRLRYLAQPLKRLLNQDTLLRRNEKYIIECRIALKKLYAFFFEPFIGEAEDNKISF
jgi:hypothetical protein